MLLGFIVSQSFTIGNPINQDHLDVATRCGSRDYRVNLVKTVHWVLQIPDSNTTFTRVCDAVCGYIIIRCIDLKLVCILYMYMNIYCIYIYVYVYICIYVYVYMYIYICICIYIYVYVYIYTTWYLFIPTQSTALLKPLVRQRMTRPQATLRRLRYNGVAGATGGILCMEIEWFNLVLMY